MGGDVGIVVGRPSSGGDGMRLLQLRLPLVRLHLARVTMVMACGLSKPPTHTHPHARIPNQAHTMPYRRGAVGQSRWATPIAGDRILAPSAISGAEFKVWSHACTHLPHLLSTFMRAIEADSKKPTLYRHTHVIQLKRMEGLCVPIMRKSRIMHNTHTHARTK